MRKWFCKSVLLPRACLKRTRQGPNRVHLEPAGRRGKRSWGRGASSRGRMQEQKEHLGQVWLPGRIWGRAWKGSSEYMKLSTLVVQGKGNKVSICPTLLPTPPIQPHTSLRHRALTSDPPAGLLTSSTWGRARTGRCLHVHSARPHAISGT